MELKRCLSEIFGDYPIDIAREFWALDIDEDGKVSREEAEIVNR